jgi:hypothetical protein
VSSQSAEAMLQAIALCEVALERELSHSDKSIEAYALTVGLDRDPERVGQLIASLGLIAGILAAQLTDIAPSAVTYLFEALRDATLRGDFP